MKLTIYLFIFSLIQIHASTYSQNTKISLKLDNTSIENVLHEIESKTEFKFLYNDNDVDYRKQVTVDAKETLVSKILDKVFTGTNITYEVLDKQIILVNEQDELNTSLVYEEQKSRKVTGTIKDDNGEPLIGVTVMIKGTSKGVTSDFDGNYTVMVKDDLAVLVFSYMGYKDKEVLVGDKSVLDVQLETSAADLEEIVLVGYGTQKRSDVTGAIASISSEKLLKAPIVKMETGMQGRVAGVTIKQSTGAPGQRMKMRIRGAGSINFSNEPLYVIDGFIGADISTINPADIAKIDILKDASATAVYGARGANGVVLISTVKPKEGPFAVTFDTNYSIGKIINKYDLLSAGEMAELYNERSVALGTTPESLPFTQQQIDDFKQNGGTDWQDLVTRQAFRTNHTLTVNGGTENLNYYFSANNLKDEGIIKNSFYKRNSIRSNISGKVGKYIDFRFNTYGTMTDSQANGVGTGGRNNPIGRAAIFPQIWPARNDAGEIIDPTTYDSYNGAFLPGRDVHPELAIDQDQVTENESLLSNLDLHFKLGNGFSFDFNNSGRITSGFTGSRQIIDNVNVNRDNLTAQHVYRRGRSYMTTGMLNYEKEFGDHKIKASAVYEFQKSTSQATTSTVGDFKTLGNGWFVLENGTPTRTASNLNANSNLGGARKIRSYMGRFNYSFKDKYLLTASLRADGNSALHPDHRWGYFPSAALAWNVTKEEFLKDSDVINRLKVRIGYGATGNTAVPNYFRFIKFDNTNAANGYSWYPFDSDGVVQGVVLADPTSPFIKWETTVQHNVGFDIGLLNNKINATLDLYNKETSDVVLKNSIPRYTGFQSFGKNSATIQNKGIELGLNFNIKDTQDFHWDAYLNVSRNVNKVKKLGGETTETFLADEAALGIWSLVGGNSKFIVKEGESMGSLFGLKAIGIWQENEATEAEAFGAKPGEVKYEDLDGSGNYSASDRQIVGNTAPDFTYGLGTSVAYKGFDATIQCVGSVGNETYNWSRNFLNQQMSTADYRNRWTSTNTGSTQQIYKPVGADLSANYVVSQYIEDASFFKISNITLGYTIPKNVASKFKISSLRFYGSIDNVLTITDYTGLDPEASSTAINSDAQAGVDAFSYPLTRTISFGAKLAF
ncbi:TonB-dependent receptor [Wenyingzhuangia sp. IMCC45574]